MIQALVLKHLLKISTFKIHRMNLKINNIYIYFLKFTYWLHVINLQFSLNIICTLVSCPWFKCCEYYELGVTWQVCSYSPAKMGFYFLNSVFCESVLKNLKLTWNWLQSPSWCPTLNPSFLDIQYWDYRTLPLSPVGRPLPFTEK